MMNAHWFLLAEGGIWLGPAASTSAQRHDAVFHTVLYVTGFFFFLVMTLMVAFIVLYRRRKGQRPEDAPTHNTALEVAWTLIPLGVVTTFFIIGFRAYLQEDTPPGNAEVIEAEAFQWAYSFRYSNGAKSDKLYLRVNQPVVLQLTSSDVLHALYIPAFRIQRNAVPNRTVEMWFQPTEIGTYHVFCTQYCGNGHSLMATEAIVLDEDAYRTKLADLGNIFMDPVTKTPLPYAAVGKILYETSGCRQCHSIDGSRNSGPTWQGLYKRDISFSKAPAGYTLRAEDDDAKWEAYLREAILNPGVTIVDGYQNVMPQTYGKQFSGSPANEKQLAAIIEFIKSLDNNGPGGAPKYYRPMPIPKADEGAKPAGQTGSAGAKPGPQSLPPPPPLPSGEETK